MLRKWMGFDTELANAFYRPEAPLRAGACKAAWLLLEGLRADGWREDPATSPDLLDLAGGRCDLDAFPPELEGWDWHVSGIGRTWMVQGVPGGCALFDHSHLEVCSPECPSPRELLLSWAAWRAHLGELRERIQQLLPAGTQLLLAASVCDGRVSWGSHLNTLIEDELFEALMRNGPQRDGYLAFLVSSGLYAGAGWLTPRGQRILSQRAPFLGCIASGNTTRDHARPLLNTRDEPHTSEGRRLHTICFDSLLLPFAFLLSRGIHALVLALLEEQPLALRDLALARPLAALRRWNRARNLRLPQPLADGRRLSLIELQREVQRRLERLDPGLAEAAVPGARELLAMLDSTLGAFERDDCAWLERRIQWVHRHALLESLQQQWGVPPSDPRLALLDHAYDLLDPERGLALAAEGDGAFGFIRVSRAWGHPTSSRFVSWSPRRRSSK